MIRNIVQLGFIVMGFSLVIGQIAIANDNFGVGTRDLMVVRDDYDEIKDRLVDYIGETENQEVDQVTNVNQLRDVRATDWAFEALRNLVERYGCISYPDEKFLGQRALTRFEFATGVNACLRQIEGLITASSTDLIVKADLVVIQRLYDEFGAELKIIRGKADRIEGEVSVLEENLFSPTTKLSGQVIIGFADALGDNVALPSEFRDVPFPNSVESINPTPSINGAAPRVTGPMTQDANTIVGTRVRLSLKTSFTGRDELLTALNYNNLTQFSNNNPPNAPIGIAGQVTGTAMTRLGFDGPTGFASNLNVDHLWYRFSPEKNTTIFLTGAGLEINDHLETFNPYFLTVGLGSISRFGRFNPIYRINGGSGAGVTIIHKFNSTFNISALYSGQSRSSDNSSRNRGLFNGAYSALVQVGINPSRNLGLGLIYARSYYPGSTGAGIITNLSGTTGSDFANRPFRLPGISPDAIGLTVPEANLSSLINPTDVGMVATSSDSVAFNFSYSISNRFVLSGWSTYQSAYAQKTVWSGIPDGSGGFLPIIRKSDRANIWNWALTFAFPDLGGRGNLLGLVFGMPPKATDNDLARRVRAIQSQLPGITPGRTSFDRVDRDTSYHLEAFYRIRLMDHIHLTPGVIWIINPEHNGRNPDNMVGVLRTTFSF